jgi:hypothetical protein
VSYPDRSRGEVSLGGRTASQVCDGKSAWIGTGDAVRDATPLIGEFERGIALFGGGWGIYKRALAGTVEVSAIGEEEIDGTKTTGVSVQGPFGNLKLYFDPATHLLAAARYQATGPQGPIDSEQHWSDYREVEGGRKFAFSTVIFHDGAKFADTAVKELKLNPPAEDSQFAKPESASK